jgi:adenylosuccinate lyase
MRSRKVDEEIHGHEASPEEDKGDIYWCVNPLDYRYYGAYKEFFDRLYPYISQDAYVKHLLRVEATLVKMLARWGICTEEEADEVQKACENIRASEVDREEQRVHHDVRALVNCIRRRVSPRARQYVHLFATSADITDTANALRFKELVKEVILPDLLELQRLLIDLARKYADLVQIGRTHGEHAEPITVGYAIACYVSRLGGRIERIAEAMDNLRGKFSGSVGAYNALSLFHPDDPAVLETEFLEELGLEATDTNISTQIVEPEFITDLAFAIVSTYSVLANFADDIRHLHRAEISEIQERYVIDDIGSSTMPHKVNPKNFENIKSMWKEYMPRMVTIFMDQISEHQRDLTNSASSRYITELFTAFDYSIIRLTKAMKRVYIDTENIKKNLGISKGDIVAEPLYIMLTLNGFTDAYDYVRKLVKKSETTERNLIDTIWEDEKIESFLKKLNEKQIKILKDPSLYTGAAHQRTLATCDHWEKAASLLSKRLKT